jgi:hypothetical protein
MRASIQKERRTRCYTSDALVNASRAEEAAELNSDRSPTDLHSSFSELIFDKLPSVVIEKCGADGIFGIYSITPSVCYERLKVTLQITRA